MPSLQVSDSSFQQMCYCVGLDVHATDFAPVPSSPFREPVLSISPVTPNALSLWFPAALLTPSMGDRGGGGRKSSASGATTHLRETSPALGLHPCSRLLITALVMVLGSSLPTILFSSFRIKAHPAVQPQPAPPLISAS